MRTRNEREWLEFLGALRFRNRFIKTFDCDKVRAIPLVSRCVAWFHLDRSLEFSFRLGAVPVPAKLDERQRRMRFSLILVDLQRLHRRVFCFWEPFLGLQTSINNEHVVTVSKSRVSLRIV